MTPDESPRHVLYVDDYEPMRELASDALERAGFTVTACPDAASALAAAALPQCFDIAVVDFDLPGMRGDELARRLTDCAALPVVLVSGEVDAGMRAQAEAAGAGALLHKARLYDELPHLVRALLVR